jgi:phage terminase Nu1 subunit (DNA packaging protein)
MTQQEIADQLGISLRTLTRYKEQGAPVHNGPTAVLAWMAKNHAKTITGDENLRDRLVRAQAEHYETKTELARLKHQVQTGELVELAAVEDYFKRMFAPVVEHLRTQPDRLCSRVNPSDPVHAREVLLEERESVFKLAQAQA